MRAMMSIAAFLFVGFPAPPMIAQDRPEIRIGTEGAYPPWNATSADGDLEGFEIDLAHDLCRRMAVDCEIVSQHWAGMIPALVTGKYDVIMAGMPITDEREATIDFSSCYAAEGVAFAVVSASALAATPVDGERIRLESAATGSEQEIEALRQLLAGTVIGAQIATTHADFLKAYFSDIIEIRHVDTLENLAVYLAAGRIDAALAPQGFWKKLVDGGNEVDLTLVSPAIAGGVLGKGIGLGFRKEDDDLLGKFDAVVKAALADGTVKRLSEQWFGFDISCG